MKHFRLLTLLLALPCFAQPSHVGMDYYLVGHAGDKVSGGTIVTCSAPAHPRSCASAPNGIYVVMLPTQQDVLVNGLVVKVPPQFPEDRKPWNRPKNPHQPAGRTDPRTILNGGPQ